MPDDQNHRDLPVAELSSAALAYLGDSVLEVCVRTYLVTERGLSTSAHLNAAALDFVRAPAQAEAMKNLLPHLHFQPPMRQDMSHDIIGPHEV